jgi:vitamin B12 transporter
MEGSFSMSQPARGTSRKQSVLALLLCAAALLMYAVPARAVVVRGTVTTALGIPVGNVRVQLVKGQKVAAFAISGSDGTFEIRSTSSGRFLLLASAYPYTPGIGQDFYGGRTSVITRNVVLETASITPLLATTVTGIPTPLPQISAPVTLIPLSALATQVTLVNDLRQSPGNVVLQTGQTGGPASLLVRGGSFDANKVLLDGISAEDVGGRFDFSTLSTFGLSGPELARGANSALYGAGATASVVSLATQRGNSLRPVLNYTGDAGNFHTWRNEGVVSGAYSGLDYYAGFSRFDTSNALSMDQFHNANSVANIGYSITTNTLARFTLRNSVSASGLPGPHDFFAISAAGKQANQNIASGLTVENRLAGNWHNLARYGIVRNREQVYQFYAAGELHELPSGQAAWFGDTVTIRGANGYQATGRAAIAYPDPYPFHRLSDSNRDELYYQSDYLFPHRIATLFAFHYENERGSYITNDLNPVSRQLQRTNFQYTLQLQGDIKHRLFYSLGASIEKNHLFGVLGTPRIGLAYTPVFPSRRIFRGTRLRASVATGVQEPSLNVQFTSLYDQLQQSGDTAAITTYNIRPIKALRSRTYDIGIDQSILYQKLMLKAGYFHNTFDHQIESADRGTLQSIFNLPPAAIGYDPASLNSLAYHTQGMELELQYQPFSHLVLNGGYTYLASLVTQSLSSSILAAGIETTNPNLPGIPIGATSPLIGARAFHRPPQTGFFAAQYTISRLSAGLKGALSSRSDGSTFLTNADYNFGNTLLLPNRNLDSGYAKLDLNLLFAATKRVAAFTQLDNLLGQQHIGPIGYPGLPFTIRAGLKIRVGGY